MGRRFSRRRFLKLLAGMAVAGAGGYAVYSSMGNVVSRTLGGETAGEVTSIAREMLANGQERYLRQLICSDNTSCRTIMWQSDEPMDNPAIEYAETDNLKTLGMVPAVRADFSDDGYDYIQYKAELTDLKADTSYQFRVSDDNGAGEWHPICTDGKNSFQMLVFPDSQSSTYDDWENVAQEAAKRHPEAALFTVLGDLVDNGEDSSQWRAWFNALKGIIDALPFAPVMGNHDTYTREWTFRKPVSYLGYFAHPDNGSQKFNQYYYSFDFGDAHFAVINTQSYELGLYENGELVHEQQAWLRKDMRSSSKKWKIVMMHRDVLTYRINGRPERREGIEDEGVQFMPLFEELEVDLVLTAHLHTYRNRGHIFNFESSDHGPVYILTGVAGNVRYNNLWIDHALDRYVAPQPETDNYLTMDFSENTIAVRCYLPDGTLLDETVLQK
ncbi:MAG: metallophosphoesterase [Selenomonadaceae bacterium]